VLVSQQVILVSVSGGTQFWEVVEHTAACVHTCLMRQLEGCCGAEVKCWGRGRSRWI
jgi:hypothetical protein